jgi:hypothetical protein
MDQKELIVKSFKLPFLPIHIMLGGEVKRVKKTLADLYVGHRLTGQIMEENFKYKTKYGPLRS